MTPPDVSPVVLDTSVVSLLMRGDADSTYYKSEIQGLRAVISFQTREEALFGAIRAGWGPRRISELQQHLGQYETVWSSLEMVEISARLRSDREKAGRRLNTADAWIAATAIMLDCPLASHDGDFSDIPDLELIRAP